MCDGVLAYMSRPGKSGKRKYVYKNFNTHEYSFEKLPDVEYCESKLVYSTIEMLKKGEEFYSRFNILSNPWKRI